MKEEITTSPSQRDNRTILQEIHATLMTLNQYLQNLFKVPTVIPIMTYESAIKYFVTERPKEPQYIKGALLKRSHKQGYWMVQVFLDQNNNLIYTDSRTLYGRQLVAKDLDDELKEAFGKEELIIVE